MDIFRLLTRSTKLSSTSSKEPLPSQGRAKNPQLFSHGQDDREKPFGKKRKRDGISPTESTNLSAELDFFNENTGATPPKSSSKTPSKSSVTRTSPPAKDLSLEDRIQILHNHKVKVTLLESSGQLQPRKGKKSENISKKQRKQLSRIYPEPLTSFDQLRSRYGISRRLAENLHQQGYTVPTEVQIGSLPILMNGGGTTSGLPADSVNDIDLLTVAPTGSGKTLAFLIPLVDRLLRERHEKGHREEELDGQQVKGLIVVPTKELAAQIVNEGRKLTAGTGIKVTAMHKGMTMGEGEVDDKIKIKSEILVTTPMVLLNSLDDEKSPCLPSIRHLILDEADVLLDPLFRDQTLGIWKACINPALRVSLWSATIGANIETLAKDTILSRRKALQITSTKSWYLIRLVVGLKDSAVPNIAHRLIYTATEAGKLLALRQLLHSSSTTPLRPPFLIFTQTIPRALALHSELLYDIPAQAGGSTRIAVLHASLSDKGRSEIMANFRKGSIWILITTDLLARGVDFRGLNAVVNYDIPNSAAAYIHRVGRTGRAGREGGVAVTFYTNEDVGFVRDVASVIQASERLGRQDGGEGREKKKSKKGEEEKEKESSIQPWLLTSLPKPSKNQRKAMKRGGIPERRPTPGRVPSGASSRKSITSEKISTLNQDADKNEKDDEERVEKGRDDDNDEERKKRDRKLKAKMRISTISGFDRRRYRASSQRRLPTTSSEKQRSKAHHLDLNGAMNVESSEWSGFSDD